MQGGTQRIGGEVLLPQSWREFVDSIRGVLTDTLQHIDEIVVGIDPVQSASDDQTLHDTDVMGADFGPAK